MRINYKLRLCLSICFKIHLLQPTSVSANNANYVSIDGDVITETSVKNGQTQYEMINRDASMPR